MCRRKLRRGSARSVAAALATGLGIVFLSAGFRMLGSGQGDRLCHGAVALTDQHMAHVWGGESNYCKLSEKYEFEDQEGTATLGCNRCYETVPGVPGNVQPECPETAKKYTAKSILKYTKCENESGNLNNGKECDEGTEMEIYQEWYCEPDGNVQDDYQCASDYKGCEQAVNYRCIKCKEEVEKGDPYTITAYTCIPIDPD